MKKSNSGKNAERHTCRVAPLKNGTHCINTVKVKRLHYTRLSIDYKLYKLQDYQFNK